MKSKGTKVERAQELHAKLKNARVAIRAHWAIYGEMAREFHDKELFKLVGYKTWEAFMKTLGAARSTIFEAMQIAEAFSSLTVNQRAQYPKENLKLLRHLPERERTSKKWLEAAGALKAKDLRIKLNKEKSQHLEDKVRLTFDCTGSQAKVIERVLLKIAKWAKEQDGEELTSRGDLLEWAMVDLEQRYA